VSVEMNGQLGLIASFLTGAAAQKQIFSAGEGKNFSFFLAALLQGSPGIREMPFQSAEGAVFPGFAGEEGEEEALLLFPVLAQGFLPPVGEIPPAGSLEASPGGESEFLPPSQDKSPAEGRVALTAGGKASKVNLPEGMLAPPVGKGEKPAEEVVLGPVRLVSGSSGVLPANNAHCPPPLEKAGEKLPISTGGEGKQGDNSFSFPAESRMWAESPGAMVSGKGESPFPEALSFRQVADQLVRSGKLKSLGQKSQVEIKLKPEYLGRLEIRLTLTEGVLTARFLVENQQLGRLLDGNLFNLRQTLEEQGLKLDQLQVEVGHSGAFSRQEDKQWSGRPPLFWQAKPAGEQEDPASFAGGKFSAGSIDYHA
jgi:hypothetical protein